MSGGRRRAALAQNLFRSDEPARALVRAAGVRPGDLVYDLGAGTGRVTAALLRAGARVVAVERDPNLARKLGARFAGAPVRVVEADLTRIVLEPGSSVVANLPFNVTAAALRRVLSEGSPLERASLVLQLEAARKFAGATRTTAVSLAAQPWFEFDLSRPFQRRDFVPAPSVEVALLRIERRPAPLLAADDRAAWQAFVRWALARPRPEARSVFRPVLSNLQWRRLTVDLGLAPDALRDDLTLDQWLGLFRFVQRCAPPQKRRVIG